MLSTKLPEVSELIWQDKDRMSGAPCIFGTRVRIQDFFDWMTGGGSVDGFLATYPHVPRKVVVGLLRLAERDLIRDAELV